MRLQKIKTGVPRSSYGNFQRPVNAGKASGTDLRYAVFLSPAMVAPGLPARGSGHSHLSVCVVGVPRRPKRLLPSDIPHQKARVVDHYLFHVTPYGGRGMHHFVHGAAEGREQLGQTRHCRAP